MQKTLVITNRLGIHARAAAMISEAARGAVGAVHIIHADETANAASLLDILSLAVGLGGRITVRVENPEDAPVLQRIEAMVTSGFGEK